MKNFDQYFSIETLPSIIGTGWFEKNESIWLSDTKDFDFTKPPTETYGKAGIILALKAGDWKLATNIALTINGKVCLDTALTIAYELDSPILVFSLTCFYKHYYTQLNTYFIDTNISINALELKADKCFLLGLVEPNFNVQFQTSIFDLTSEKKYCTDAEVIRPLDTLLLPEFKEILDKLPLGTDFDVVTSAFNHGEECKVNLFAALILEKKWEQAKSLIKRSWDNINPSLEVFDCSLFDHAICEYQDGSPEILEVLYSIILPSFQNLNQVFHCETDNIEDLLKYSSSSNEFLNKIEKITFEMLAQRSPTQQIEASPYVSDLLYRPFPQGTNPQTNKKMSICNDLKRISPDFLKPHVTDLCISLMEKCLLVIELYSYNSTSPSKRAIIDMTRYENFAHLYSQVQMVQSQPTDFQIQLAFLSLSHNDLKDVFSELTSIEKPE